MSSRFGPHMAPSPRGFTLLEIVVTLGVFSIASLMAIGLFIVFVQQQRRTLSQQELQNDSRAVIEQIVQDLHEGTVDYDYYSSTFSATNARLRSSFDGQADSTNGNQYLVIRDAQNNQVYYRVAAAGNSKEIDRCQTTTGTSPVTCQNAADWVAITPSTLNVTSFTFTISPSEDPFAAKAPKSCTYVTGTDPIGTCRWGTTCQNQNGTDTCQLSRGNACYCAPYTFNSVVRTLQPTVTVSLNVMRQVGQQQVSQLFQTTVTSRQFGGLSQLNTYAP